MDSNDILFLHIIQNIINKSQKMVIVYWIKITLIEFCMSLSNKISWRKE